MHDINKDGKVDRDEALGTLEAERVSAKGALDVKRMKAIDAQIAELKKKDSDYVLPNLTEAKIHAGDLAKNDAPNRADDEKKSSVGQKVASGAYASVNAASAPVNAVGEGIIDSIANRANIWWDAITDKIREWSFKFGVRWVPGKNKKKD